MVTLSYAVAPIPVIHTALCLQALIPSAYVLSLENDTMKIWHFYCIKSPLLLVGYLFGTQDPAFLIVALLSALAIPLFAYFGE
jgi:hypothetical protein